MASSVNPRSKRARITFLADRLPHVMSAAQVTLTTAVLLNGGAAAAVFAYIEVIAQRGSGYPALSKLTEILFILVAGTFAAAFATGLSFLAQFLYFQGRGDAVRVARALTRGNIGFVGLAYLLFAIGGAKAYAVFNEVAVTAAYSATPSHLPSDALPRLDVARSAAPTSETVENHADTYSFWLMAFTGVLAASTIALWISTRRAGKDTLRMAKAAEDANQLTGRMLASNRPWITVEVRIVSGLTYDRDGWQLTIHYTLKNIGASPATHVTVSANFIPCVLESWPADEIKGRSWEELPNLGTNTPTELKNMCSQSESMTRTRGGFGVTLFAGQALSDNFRINNAGPLFEKAKGLPSYSGHFDLILCAGYGSTFDSDPRVTAKAFTIFKRETGRGFEKIDLSGETVPGDQLTYAPIPGALTDIAT